jgi:hypothetical protein
MPTSRAKSPYAVGQWVYLGTGPNRMKAQVLEDLGRLGVNGEHVYSILVFFGDGEGEEMQRDANETRLTPIP